MQNHSSRNHLQTFHFPLDFLRAFVLSQLGRSIFLGTWKGGWDFGGRGGGAGTTRSLGCIQAKLCAIVHVPYSPDQKE